MNDDLETKYLTMIQSLISRLEPQDARALQSLASEYMKNKGMIGNLIQETEDLIQENDVIYIFNFVETLLRKSKARDRSGTTKVD